MNYLTSFIILLVILGVGGILLFLVLRDTARGKGRWRISPKSVNCPRCSEPTPQIRIPTSVRQTAWGGWTCARCGCEMDKWGAEISQGKLNT